MADTDAGQPSQRAKTLVSGAKCYLTIGGGLLETDTVVSTPQIADATGHH